MKVGGIELVELPEDSESLKAVVLIVDIRRIPGVEEQNFIDWLALYHRKAILVLTKVDKLSKSAAQKQRRSTAAALGMEASNLILFSAKTRQGKAELWSAIEKGITEAHHERQ